MASSVPSIDVLKQRARSAWTAGDFGQIAKMNQAWADEFIARLNLKPGMKVLDIGCGTGNQAIAAARTGASVTGVDIAPNLLEQARERARQENLSIDFQEGDAEQLTQPDREFDVVLSMFGAMFAPRPELVAAEMVRVSKPGGLIAMGNWTPTSFVAETFKVTSRHVAPPPNVPPPALWGDDAIVRKRLGDRVSVETRPVQLKFNFPFSAERVVDFFRQYFGPTTMAFNSLDEEKQQALRNDLIELYTRRNEGPSDAVVVTMEYLEVHARVKA
jgi:ubiquinone/menaquinone biosynthesis C-methylase UbiE